MLGNLAEMCYKMLDDVGLSLKIMSSNFHNIFGRCMMLYLFRHIRATLLKRCLRPINRFAISKRHPACCNILQQRGQMCSTCYAQQCCSMLDGNVACVWPAPSRNPTHDPAMLHCPTLKRCLHLDTPLEYIRFSSPAKFFFPIASAV